MKNLLSLMSSIILCWIHGFGTKTGAELFLLDAALKENKKFKRGSQRNPKTEARDLQRRYSQRLRNRRQ